MIFYNYLIYLKIKMIECNTGEIPASLGELANLTELNLGLNNLSGKDDEWSVQYSRLCFVFRLSFFPV